MATIKVVLRKNYKKKDGTCPLAIRITQNRKSRFIFTGKYIKEKDWDSTTNKVKKSHRNSARLNHFLMTKQVEANNKALELEISKKLVSSKSVKEEIKNPISERSFNELAKIYLQELEENNKLTQLSSDKARVNNFLEFAKSDNINFRDINEPFLKRYLSFLKNERKNCERSRVNSLVVIRIIYNNAIREGIIERKFYPFGKGRIRIKLEGGKKIGLSKKEVKKIESLKNLTEQQEHARNVWLFSFYFAGMRAADVLKTKWSDFKSQRFHYTMNKNKKEVNVKIPDKVYPILEIYKQGKRKKDDFVFPELKKANLEIPKDVLAKTKTANKKFNKYLKEIREKAKIDTPITMHTARHTFGNISGDSIPIQTLQKLYRHSSIITTINYQNNFIHKDFDKALDSVINF